MDSTLNAPSMLHPALGFAKGYAVTMRPYLLFVSGITGLAGFSFGEAHAGVAGVFAACFLSYGFGQALTDCFQTDTDAISSPYRPLTRGAISRRWTMIVSLAGLVACVAILGAANPWNLALGAAAGAGLATYTWFKRRWWGGPWYNAWIVLALFLMGFLASGGGPIQSPEAFLWAGAGTVFGYANFVLAGYFKDIEADRATGYDTIPVRFGRRTAAFASDLLAAGLAASIAGTAAAIGPPGPGSTGAWSFLVVSLAALIIAQWRLHRNRTDDTAHAAIIPVVHACVAFLCGVTAAREPGWLLPLTIFYGTFWLVLARRPERTQV